MESSSVRRVAKLKIWEFKDYDEYVAEQTKANKLKINWRYVKDHAISSIAKNKGDEQVKFIVCHGTRNGTEQKLFQKHYPSAKIIGTEISETATQFEMTIQHDFTMPIEEWVGKADIVYSNSFDHTIDPVKTIQTWRDQLSPEGTLYLEYNQGLSVCEPNDPLDATMKEVRDMIEDNELKIVTTLNGSCGGTTLVCKRK